MAARRLTAAMIHLDTSILIDALTGPRRSLPAIRRAVAEGHRLAISAIVLFEWRRGPRKPRELVDQAALLPDTAVVAFGPAEASAAADLYRTIRKPRGREADLAVAATALTRRAVFWTLNQRDFADVPGLDLY